MWIKVNKNSYCGKMSLIVFWDYTEGCTLCVVQIHFIIVTDIRDLDINFLSHYSLYIHHMELWCSNSKWLLN